LTVLTLLTIEVFPLCIYPRVTANLNSGGNGRLLLRFNR